MASRGRNVIERIIRFVFDRSSARRAEREAKESLGGIGRILGALKDQFLALGATIAAVFSVRAIIRWGNEAVRAGINAAETLSKFNTTFGESATVMDGFVKDWVALSGLTQSAGRDMAATLGAIAQGFGLNQQQSADFSARLVKLAGDLTSFHNVPIEETFNALRSGLTETEPLKQFGIVINQNEVNLRALAEAHKTEVDQLTRAEIVQARVNLIYERAGVAVGDLERTQGSLANQLRQLGGAWARLQEAVGIAIVENNDATGVIGALRSAIESLTVWVEENAEVFSTLGIVLGGLVKTLGLVLDGWWRLMNLVTSGWTGFVGLITDGTADMVDGFATLIDGLAKVKRFFGFAEGAMEQTADTLHERAAQLRRAATDLFDTADALRASARQGRGPSGPDRFVPSPQAQGGPAGGPTPEAVDPEAIKKANELRERGVQVTEELRTATEVYNDTLKELQTLLDAGAITEETYNRGRVEAQKTLDEANEKLDEHAKAVARANEILGQHERQMASLRSTAFGMELQYEQLSAEANALTSALERMISAGIDPSDEAYANLATRLEDVRAGLNATQDQLALTGQVAEVTGALLGGVLGGNLADVAAGKAKQNALLAAEQAVEGLVASLNPFTAASAPAHFAAAGKYAALATAWGALSASLGGAGGGSGSIGGGGGGSPGVATNLGGNIVDPRQGDEVHIYFTGPGFSAVNPQVQRVVTGALQLVQERYGDNTTIRVHRENEA